MATQPIGELLNHPLNSRLKHVNSPSGASKVLLSCHALFPDWHVARLTRIRCLAQHDRFCAGLIVLAALHTAAADKS